MAQIDLSAKQKQTHRHRGQTCGRRGRGQGRGMDWKFKGGRCKLSHLECINRVLLYSTGNYIQSPEINHNRKEYFKKNVYMCKTESLCYTVETVITLWISYTSILIKEYTHVQNVKPHSPLANEKTLNKHVGKRLWMGWGTRQSEYFNKILISSVRAA